MKTKNILVIARKELRSYFDNPTAYIILIAFLLLWDFLFFRNAFLIGEASLRSMFTILPWLFLLLIPAITMGSISQEKREGTLEFLLTHPLKDIELIIGKFLGSLVFSAIALLFVFPIAWSFSQYGNLDWGVLFGQYLAGIFMAVTIIALGIFISGIFSSQVSALLVTVLASFFLIVTGFGMVADRLPLAIAPILEQLSVITHFDSMSRGVIDFRDLWYFISASAAFLSLAYLGLVKRRFGNNKKEYKNYQAGIILFVGITILTNAISARIPGRIDLTQNNIYTISAQTREAMGSLEDVVNIDFFASSKLPAQLQPTLRDAQDILNDYKALGKGNIVVNRKDPSSDADVAEEAMKLGIREIQFNVISQEELQVKNGYLGLAVSYGGASESIPFIENTNDLEYQLTSFIKKLTVKEKKKLGFLAGHGEKTSAANMRSLSKELQKQYEITDISPAGADPEAGPAGSDPEKTEPNKLVIPEDLDALVIAGPTQAINEQERVTITEFIKNGKVAMFLIDPVTITPQIMTASENTNSLADFVKDNYGVEVNKDMVYDLRSNETVNFGSFFLPYPLWIKAAFVGDQLAGNKVGSVMLPWASSLAVNNDKAKEAGFVVKNLLETTKFAGTQTGTFVIKADQSFSQEGLAKKVMAVSLEEEKEEGQGRIRLIIVGDSDFITDQYVTNSPGNFAFAVDSLSRLLQEESLAGIKVKSQEERKLLFEDQSQANAVKFGNMALAFLAPLILGTWRITRRKRMQSGSYRN